MTEAARLLEAIGWSDTELATRLGISGSTAHSWVTGRRETPANVLAWLRKVLDGVEAAGPLPVGWAPWPAAPAR